MTRIAIYILIIFSFAGCSREQFSGYDIAFGESVNHSKELTVQFLEVVEDSRCPSSVDCIWHGTVTIKLAFTLENDQVTFVELISNPSAPAQAKATVGEFSVELTDVSPYPADEIPIPHEDYVIRLVISE